MKRVAATSMDEIAWVLLKTHAGQEIAEARTALLCVAPSLMERPDFKNARANLVRKDLVVASRERGDGCPVPSLIYKQGLTVTEEEIEEADLAEVRDVNNDAIETIKARAVREFASPSEKLLELVAAAERIPVPPLGKVAPNWSAERDPWDFHRTIWRYWPPVGRYVVIDGINRTLALAHRRFSMKEPWINFRALVIRQSQYTQPT